MDTSLTAWLVIVQITGGLAAVAIWSRTRSFVRGLAVILFFVGVPATGLAALSGLGSAAPVIPGINAPSGDDIRILGVKLVQDVAIYVLVDTEGEPTFYTLPWDQETADAIQGELDNPDSAGMSLEFPFEFSWDQHVVVHPLPQPMDPPPKPAPKQAPHFNSGI